MVAGADRTRVKGFRRNKALRSCQITPDRNWAGSGRPAAARVFGLDFVPLVCHGQRCRIRMLQRIQ